MTHFPQKWGPAQPHPFRSRVGSRSPVEKRDQQQPMTTTAAPGATPSATNASSTMVDRQRAAVNLDMPLCKVCRFPLRKPDIGALPMPLRAGGRVLVEMIPMHPECCAHAYELIGNMEIPEVEAGYGS